QRKVEDDPENRLIMKLRIVDNLPWGRIAEIVNKERRENGEEGKGEMTHPGVYGRFVRNAPKIARKDGLVGFRVEDYMQKHMKTAGEGGVGLNAAPMTTIPNRRKRKETETPKAHRSAKKAKLVYDCKELETRNMLQLLVQAHDTVKDTFWTFVGHEMERLSGKVFEPEALEKRFHQL
ncbi:hypothetical protein BCR34DRAFT_444355, partial [Clohesyomyces aquaticus]